MATYLYLQGKVKWCRVKAPDKWGNWKVSLYPTPESKDKILELQTEGLKNTMKKDEDGYFFVFRRPVERSYQGRMKGFAPPEVLDKDGRPLSQPVGNGSDVTLKLEVYSYKPPGQTERQKAARLTAIRVDNLVPFSGKEDFDPETEKLVRGLAEQPEQLF